jgi:hypothetical protein
MAFTWQSRLPKGRTIFSRSGAHRQQASFHRSLGRRRLHAMILDTKHRSLPLDCHRATNPARKRRCGPQHTAGVARTSGAVAARGKRRSAPSRAHAQAVLAQAPRAPRGHRPGLGLAAGQRRAHGLGTDWIRAGRDRGARRGRGAGTAKCPARTGVYRNDAAAPPPASGSEGPARGGGGAGAGRL